MTLREAKLKTLLRPIAMGAKSLERGQGIEYRSVRELFADIKSEASKPAREQRGRA